MTGTVPRIAIALALGLAITPAGAQPKKAGATRALPSFISVGGFDMIPKTSCDPNNKLKAGPPVTVPIGTILADLTTNGKITNKNTRKVNGQDQPVGPPDNVGNNWPTSLDMELAQSDGSGGYIANDYVMVTVVLTVNRGMNFLRPVNAYEYDSSAAVTVAPGTGGNFCGRTDTVKVTTRGTTTQSVSFGVKKNSAVMSFNIGIMIPDKVNNPTLWLPIILDPSVRNKG